jgi:hypothetical protein
MRELDKPISKEYLPLTLFRDDLESIERVLKQSTEAVEIEAGGFQFDSIDELITKLSDRRVREMEIRASRPYIRIELAPMWAKLYVGSSANASAGPFYRLDQVLRRARRRLWPLYSFYFVWIVNGALWVSIPLRPKVSRAATIVFTATSLAWVVWTVYVRLRRHSTIILIPRGSASFWVRKKDELLLAVVSALLGAILGAAGVLLVRYFGK